MTAPDLLPCPWCGHKPRMWEHHVGGCEIECVNGHCPSEPHVGMPTTAEAIAAWNTRAPRAEAHPLASEARMALERDDVAGWIGSLPKAPLAEALAVPEVAALIYAAKMVMHDLHHGNGLDGLYKNRDRLDAALHAIGGDA